MNCKRLDKRKTQIALSYKVLFKQQCYQKLPKFNVHYAYLQTEKIKDSIT